MENLFEKILRIKTESEFINLALKIFNFQYSNNKIYQAYVDRLNRKPEKIKYLEEIPFLPITFFKTQKIITGNIQPELFFQSSGTTGQQKSKHWIVDSQKYIKSFIQTFQYFYGNYKKYCFLALLPSYLEQQHSSLVLMLDYFIRNSECKKSAFVLNDFDKLSNMLNELETNGTRTILFGVSYALMDFAKYFNKPLKHTIVIETGGMKGRRNECSKTELHRYLKKYFQTEIHAEYGMTELLTQAYGQASEKFKYPQWMKILIRDRYDPFSYLPNNKTGGINIIDLANIDSCCFIETQDLGRKYADNSFQLLGRYDVADIRGCNLLLEKE